MIALRCIDKSKTILLWNPIFDPCDPKWPQVDPWPHNIFRGSQSNVYAKVLRSSYLIYSQAAYVTKQGLFSIILPSLIFYFYVFDNTVRYHFQLVVKFVISFLSVGGAFQNGRHFQPKSHVNQPLCKYMVSRCTESDSFELYLTLLIRFK